MIRLSYRLITYLMLCFVLYHDFCCIVCVIVLCYGVLCCDVLCCRYSSVWWKVVRYMIGLGVVNARFV